jgi:glutaminyl-peptide cyclotransferase
MCLKMNNVSPRFLLGMFALLATIYLGCISTANSNVPVWKAKAVATFPHDPDAYTQGLTIRDGKLFEGTGKLGSSTLRQVDLVTGAVVKSVPLDSKFFGEGITIVGGKIYQLTWRNNFCFTYDANTLEYQETFRYPFEGWGLTDNGKELILSDGSSDIRFIEPVTFNEARRIGVKEGTERIKNLNELEYIDGEIWANIWYEDRIARISPETGKVLGWIDLSSLFPKSQRTDRDHVLNGIAQDPRTKKIYVTGKNWPKLFEIEITK